MLGPQHLPIWDQVAPAPPRARAVTLASLFGDVTIRDAAAWPVGERDAFLLSMHRAAFGDRLDLWAPCPACAEPAAFDITISALLAQPAAAEWPLRICHGGLTLICRRPSTADLAAAWASTQSLDLAPSLDLARARLVAACVTVEDADGRAVGAEALDADLASAALTAADPLGDIRFSLRCPACGHGWNAGFDPPLALWRAFDAWARHLLEDVRRVARFYGWSERDILAMHPSRRRFYLDAVT